MAALLATAHADAPWECVVSSDGVTVYSRAVEGSSYRELYAECIAENPFEVAVEIAKDPEHYFEWYGMCRELSVIEKRSAHDLDMYFVLDLPVATNRDLVVNVRPEWDAKKGLCTVVINRLESAYKPDSGLVRMPVMRGTIVIERLEENRVKCTYQFFAELGGMLPAWIVNLAAKRHPYETCLGMMRQGKKEVYWRRARAATGE